MNKTLPGSIGQIKAASARLLQISLLLVLCGCRTKTQPFIPEIMTPEPPAFLTNGAAALLSRPGGWSAKISINDEGAMRTNARTGRLFVKGDRILFAQDKCDRTYIWDNAAHKGLILSEALQGYAPFSAAVFPEMINAKSETADNSSARVNGYAGHEAEISARMNDKTEVTFKVWKADALDGFPARITVPAHVSTNDFTASRAGEIVNISDFRKTVISDSLFSPPDGFTPYASPLAMTSEYMLRHSKSRQSRPAGANDAESTPSAQTHPGNRGY